MTPLKSACLMLIFLLPTAVRGYSIKDAAPLGGAKAPDAESLLRKEDGEAQKAPSEEEQLLKDTVAVLAEQTYQLELMEAKQRKAEKMAQAALPSEQKQKEAFELFDQDGSGAIDHADLRAVINAFGKKVMLHDVGDQIHDDVLDDLLSAADGDKDGQVTFKDYSSFLLEMAHHPNFASTLKKGHAVPLLSILTDLDAQRSGSSATETASVIDL